ncbi:MAG: Tfp pilus assembly protein PilX, partial [Rubritalea sp.]
MLFLIFVVAKYIPIRIIASTMEVILKRKHAYRYAMKKGFALISSLMIMMLLMLVALAMLSLSSTSVRSATVGKGISEAQANARMALMLA